jgi:hypothetical protein
MATGSAASAGQVTRLQIWPIAERLRTEYKVRVVLKIRLIYCLKLQDNTVVNKQLRNAKQLLLLSIISHDWRSRRGHGDLRQKNIDRETLYIRWYIQILRSLPCTSKIPPRQRPLKVVVLLCLTREIRLGTVEPSL